MRRATLALTAALFAALVLTPVARAQFGLSEWDVAFTKRDGTAATQAGSHPFAATGRLFLNTVPGEPNELEGELKDVYSGQPIGLAGSPEAVPTCSMQSFLERNSGPHYKEPPQAFHNEETNCPDAAAVGTASVALLQPKISNSAAVYNLEAPPGVAAKLGFVVATIPVTLEAVLSPKPPYRIVLRAPDAPQVQRIFGTIITLWGIPGDPAHDIVRGYCASPSAAIATGEGEGAVKSRGSCPSGGSESPFITLPRSCEGPLQSTYAVDSWAQPGSLLPDGEPNLLDPNWKSGFALTHDEATPPNPLGMTGCGKLPFSPSTSAVPTAKAASSPTGLDFGLDFQNEGIESSKEGAISAADLKKAVVTLPEGFTVNPSIAEGLEVCSEAQMARETATSQAGEGCPQASKIGTVEAESPLIEEQLHGAIYQAAPYENPFGTLVALYMVFKDPALGIQIVQPVKVESDPLTGQITTTAEDLPQLPVSHFALHFREGSRSPLATPPACGTYAVSSLLYPSSGQAPVTSISAFQIITGPNEGPCPAAGTPPFHPGLIAGSINNAAGRYSPFNIRLSRSDSEQEITHFSIKLPPGITGKLAGIPFCPEASIAAAKGRERQPHGGQEEIEHPSCPGASEIGHTLVGSGVGPSLAYVPGKVYLAGPYKGSQLSIVAITAAKAGPFDLGTVVVREALRINPETAEVFVDATGSDPIPHIIDGIPVHLRDIRAYVDRPGFVLNPTSCKPTSTASTLLGSGTDFASEADDQPVTVSTRYQAADCANLAYQPRLALKLKGKTRRGGTPQLTAILRPRAGDANSERISVALPHSEFLDQGHIGTICTRVQFKEAGGNGEACPAASVYGTVKAWTPLLSEPLTGNVYLRSSEHPLPDLVLSLHGLVDFHAVGRIDSFKGGIRNTFEFVPDAPIEKVEVKFGAGRKSLLENSTNICIGSHNAITEYTAHNGRAYKAKVPLQANCPHHRKTHKKR